MRRAGSAPGEGQPDGRLRVPVAAAFPLAQAAAAHELSETRHAREKIVLVNRPDARDRSPRTG